MTDSNRLVTLCAPRFNFIVYMFTWHTAWSYGGSSHRQFRSIGDLSFQKGYNRRPDCEFIIFDLLAPLSRSFSNSLTIQLHNWQTVYDFICWKMTSTVSWMRLCAIYKRYDKNGRDKFSEPNRLFHSCG